MWIAATVAGLFAGAGLIIAIGAQNAFVLRQRHPVGALHAGEGARVAHLRERLLEDELHSVGVGRVLDLCDLHDLNLIHTGL